MSASDIRFLRLDAIAETLDIAAMYAVAAADFALDDDEAALECALRCMVASINTTLTTWRELRQQSSAGETSSNNRRAA
jgi:hypothetical protein